MNSVLQCLARCKRLRETLNKEEADPGKNNLKAILLGWELKEIARTEKDEPHDPEALHAEVMSWKKCSDWAEREQQDAGEFLRILIDELQGDKTEAGNLFRGDQTSLRTCKTCRSQKP